MDKSAPMHGAQAYAEAPGEAGRASSQTLYFAFNPKMSNVPEAWMDADPFWAPKPVAPPKPPEKKK